jgi:hypothetical protein
VVLDITDEITNRVDEFSGGVGNISDGIANIIENISMDVTSKINNVSDNLSGIFVHFADRQTHKSSFKIRNRKNFKIKRRGGDDERTNS